MLSSGLNVSCHRFVHFLGHFKMFKHIMSLETTLRYFEDQKKKPSLYSFNMISHISLKFILLRVGVSVSTVVHAQLQHLIKWCLHSVKKHCAKISHFKLILRLFFRFMKTTELTGLDHLSLRNSAGPSAL